LRHLNIIEKNWPVAGTFRIARSALQNIPVIQVTLTEGEMTGRAECRPYARYNETPASVIAQIESVRDAIENGATPRELQGLLAPGAARNALDCALWDLGSKITGRPVRDRLGLAAPKPRVTAFTLSIDSPEAMAQAAKSASQYPILKIKIGSDGGAETALAILRARADADLIIDANEALSPEALGQLLLALKGHRVLMIEQPLHDDIYYQLPKDDLLMSGPNSIPICADESLHNVGDLERLWQAGYRGVNVKLDKCGGLSAALELMQTAKNMGFKVMAGCMVGSSLAMAPMMMLESLADYIDLDGPLLLAEDIENGLRYDGPIVHPPTSQLWG